MMFNYKKVLLLLGLASCFWSYSLSEDRGNLKEKRIVVIIASYNNKDWYKANLDAIFSQEYSNYLIRYTDDCSPDGTGALVESYIKEKGMEDKVVLTCNEERLGALANQYSMIHSCGDLDVCIICDGDDFFADDHVLAYINKVYSESDTWLTYGQFKEYPSGAHGFCCPMPSHVVANNAFRDFQHIPSHLRTFYAGLFKQIKKEDLMYEGDFFKMAVDIAAMFPMIEMARDHFRFIPDVLYIYNAANSINNHKVSKQLQRGLDLELRGRPRYAKSNGPQITQLRDR